MRLIGPLPLTEKHSIAMSDPRSMSWLPHKDMALPCAVSDTKITVFPGLGNSS